MNKFMPYLKTAATVIVILIGYKFLVQPHLPTIQFWSWSAVRELNLRPIPCQGMGRVRILFLRQRSLL